MRTALAGLTAGAFITLVLVGGNLLPSHSATAGPGDAGLPERVAAIEDALGMSAAVSGPGFLMKYGQADVTEAWNAARSGGPAHTYKGGSTPLPAGFSEAPHVVVSLQVDPRLGLEGHPPITVLLKDVTADHFDWTLLFGNGTFPSSPSPTPPKVMLSWIAVGKRTR